MKIGIIIAMEKEFLQLKSILNESSESIIHGKKFVCGKLGDKDIIMQQCGIGKVNSTIGTVELIDNFNPDMVISTGVAGGASTNLNLEDVVVSTEIAYHDAYCGSECEFGQILGQPARFTADSRLIDKAKALKHDVAIHTGLIVSGEWFVDSKAKMRSILDKFPEAIAVDMESGSIAQTCHSYGVPFISFRIISDIPLKDNKASQYFDFWKKVAEDSFHVTKLYLESL
jgi:adenosylhomocysteine nucleosidase